MQRKHVVFAALFLALVATASLGAAVEAARTTPHASGGAAAFASRVVTLIASNQYSRAWLLLHPLHQAEAPQAEYVGCELRDPIPGHLRSVRVLAVASESITVGNKKENSEAVKVRIAIDGGAYGTVRVTDTVHAVHVDGSWRWILPQWRADQYRAGMCPDGTRAMPAPDA